MKRAVHITIAITMALATASSMVAQENSKDASGVVRVGMFWQSETHQTVPAGRTLHVHLDVGSVSVRGDSTNGKVNCTMRMRIGRTSQDAARKEFTKFNTSISNKGDNVVYTGYFPSDRSVTLIPELTISIPRETDLVYVETLGGTVMVNNITGKVELSTAGGGINVDDIGGSVKAHTLGGSIGVGKAGGNATLETAGGGITVGMLKGDLIAITEGGTTVDVTSAEGSVTIDATGGSIMVRKCKGALNATTQGGSIEIGDIGSTAILKTAGGNIRLNSALGRVQATTSQGNIKLSHLSQGANARTYAGGIEADFVASPQSFSSSTLQTDMGDIWVALPSDLKVTVKASVELANGHKIQSDFPNLHISKDNNAPTTIFADGSLNGGGGMLKVFTSGGNITFAKK
jgi:hypothetical protein